MEFPIQKFISNLIESQFPRFYKEDGETFILFVKAYYEWMEQSGNPIVEARNLFDYRDIDNTLEKFLEYFQKKYLYGIPFNIISNKRFLLKHILDVYRSKGAIQCYRLLFRLIYNEDVDVYLPGIDILRVSDGVWKEPKYLEITDTPAMSKFVGRTIYGKSSRTTAVVENFIKDNYNNDIVNIVYITNILPNGGDFKVGETIIDYADIDNDNLDYEPPVIVGSLNDLVITSGGQDFNPGDVLKIAHKDPFTEEIISFGKEGLLKVAEVFKAVGTLNFKIQSSGFGFTANSLTFVYNSLYDKIGFGGDFDVRTLFSKRTLTYNTDVICGFINTTLDSVNYGFPSSSGGASAVLSNCLNYKTEVFGRILSLKNIKIGNSYTLPAKTFTRSVITSIPMGGTINYSPDNLQVFDIRDNGSASGYVNGDIVTVNNLRANVNITDSRNPSTAEEHALIVGATNYTFSANSQGFSNTSDIIFIYDADSFFALGDQVYYFVPTGNTALKGLTGNTNYYINFVNNSSVALTEKAFGTNATATINTNSSGGNLSFSITNSGSYFITKNPTITISNSIGGSTTGVGANLEAGFLSYITGTGTEFTKFFANDDVIFLQANSSDANTVEYQVIKDVDSDTKIYLWGPTTYDSTAAAQYRVAPTIIPSQFADYEPAMLSSNGSINGENEFISAIPNSGNNTISKVKLLDSGRGYVEGEEIRAYLYGAVSDEIEIVASGNGYGNNERLIFSGGNPGTPARGFITVNPNGNITDVTITYGGSGYEEPPDVFVQTSLGKGATLRASIVEFNTQIEITGQVVKSGSGKSRGYWETTRGFLDSDKYIQDSYYYQDYSYEIRTARALEEYKSILYDTFHTSGAELFGKYLKTDLNTSNLIILNEPSLANTDPITLYTIVSETFITCDSGVDLPVSLIANTTGFSNTDNILIISNANSLFSVNNRVRYEVPFGNTAIGGFTANVNYYVVFANSSSVALSTTLGGGYVDITDARTTSPGEIHYLTVNPTISKPYITVDTYVYDYYEYVNIPTITADANTTSVVSSNTFVFSDIIVVSVDRDLNGSSEINPYYRSDSNSNFITSDIIAY